MGIGVETDQFWFKAFGCNHPPKQNGHFFWNTFHYNQKELRKLQHEENLWNTLYFVREIGIKWKKKKNIYSNVIVKRTILKCHLLVFVFTITVACI